MSDSGDFRFTGDQIRDYTVIMELIDATLLKARFDPDGDDPGIIHQETLELLYGAAEERLHHLHAQKEEDRIFGERGAIDSKTYEHRYGEMVVCKALQRIKLHPSFVGWPGRLTVAAATALLEDAKTIGLDIEAIWADFETFLREEGKGLVEKPGGTPAAAEESTGG